jgi:HAD superfamily hydrolase (TIGR01549 family)
LPPPAPFGHRRWRIEATYPLDVLKAVLFDVDFTLFRPGPELGPEGYQRVGERHGLHLDPDRYTEARAGAIARLQADRDLVHDEEVWIAFTEQIVLGMGGEPTGARACAVDMVGEWERHENFSLYEDALPALDELRRHGLKIGLVSNGQRDLEEFAAHHALDVDAMVGSRAHGRTKPHPSIFAAALRALDTAPDDAAMVGDSFEDDIEGARALGIRAILLDRDGRHPEAEDRIDTLLALPGALGLSSE